MNQQKIEVPTEQTQYVGEKITKKRKWDFKIKPIRIAPGHTKFIIAIQVVAIVGLSAFIISKLQSSPSSQQENEQAPQVAGLSTQIEIPESIKVSVASKTYELQTQDFDFKIVPNHIYDTDSVQYRLNNILSLLSLELEVPVKTTNYIIEYDSAKLEYWFVNRFAELETDDKIEAALVYFQDTEYIEDCITGNGSQKIPIQEFFKEFDNQIPNEISLKLISTDLTPKEKFTNSVCERITNFEEIISAVSYLPLKKTKPEDMVKVDFISKDSIHKFFRYLIKDNELIIELFNEAGFENELKKLKIVIDQEPTNYEYRIKDQSFYVVGEFKPGKVLDIETTLKHIKTSILDTHKLKPVELTFNETEHDEIKNSLDIQQYPVIVAEAFIKSAINPIERTNKIREAMFALDTTLIQQEETLSLSAILAQYTKDEKNLYNRISVKTEEGEISYFDNVQAISTLLFRTSLEAGLEIVEFLDIQKALYSDYFNDPYDEVLITTSIGEINKGEETHILDLKIKNNTNSSLLLVLDEEIQNNHYITKARIFAKSDYKAKRIELKNFSRSTFSQDQQEGFVESFVQFVDGNEQKFVTYYLK
jgi:hypothetical protein